MRELTGHKVNGVNDGLTVMVLDEPGAGGACHRAAFKRLLKLERLPAGAKMVCLNKKPIKRPTD